MQPNHKMLLIKVSWYVLWVKNMHFGHPQTPVRPLRCRRGEAEVRILNFKTTWLNFQKASHTATKRGEAELRILYFKTT